MPGLTIVNHWDYQKLSFLFVCLFACHVLQLLLQLGRGGTSTSTLSQFQINFISKIYKHAYCIPSLFGIISFFQKLWKIIFSIKFCPHKKKHFFVLVSAHFLYAEGPQSYCFSEKQIFAGMSAPGIFYTGPKIFFVFTRCYLKMLEVINTESYLRNPSKWIFSNKSIESAARRSDGE